MLRLYCSSGVVMIIEHSMDVVNEMIMNDHSMEESSYVTVRNNYNLCSECMVDLMRNCKSKVREMLHQMVILLMLFSLFLRNYL